MEATDWENQDTRYGKMTTLNHIKNSTRPTKNYNSMYIPYTDCEM